MQTWDIEGTCNDNASTRGRQVDIECLWLSGNESKVFDWTWRCEGLVENS